MNHSALEAISPIDGRYQKITLPLRPYFSEFGLFKYRIFVEIEYFIHLANIPLPQLRSVKEGSLKNLREIYRDFDLGEAGRIKEIESVTNHDVKAVEYYLKEKFEELNLGKYKEFIHFGLTSQDINNTATPLLLKAGWEELIFPKIEELLSELEKLGNLWKDIPK
jgi:adenylosuccinate lyase